MIKTGLTCKALFLFLIAVFVVFVIFASTLPADTGRADDFNVTRTAGADRYRTSAEVATEAFETAETVIIARGDNEGDFADGLAAGMLSGVLEAPILLTAPDFLPDAVETAVTELEAEQAVILGGTRAVSAAVGNSLKASGLNVDRIAGETRQETAVLIAEAAREAAETRGEAVTSAFIVNGYAPADSLVAGPAAYKNHLPLLQVWEGKVPPVTEEAIENWDIEEFYIVGGEAVVSEAVKEELSRRGRVERLAGKDRYATGVEVNRAMFPEAVDYSLVGGLNYADAIGAAVFGEPVVYVRTDTVPAAVEVYLKGRLTPDSRVNIFGGIAAVSDAVAEAIGEKITPVEEKEEHRFFVDPDLVDLEDKIDEHLMFSEEQMQLIETGAETIPLREGQREGLEEYIEKLKENARQNLDHRAASDIDSLLKTDKLFTEEEINLEALQDAAAHLYDALNTMEVKEDAVLVEESGQEIDLHQTQDPSPAGNETVTTFYGPGYKDEEDCDEYFLEAYDDVIDLSAKGYGIEGISNACENSGAVGAENHAWVGGVKSFGRQRIKIDVPIGTDVEIVTRMRYNTGATSFGDASFAGTKETVLDMRNNSHSHTIDPGLDWQIAAEKTIDIVADLIPGVPPNVGAAIDAIDLIEDYYETYQSLDPSEEGIEESIKTYQAEALPGGTYYFDVGLEAKSSALVTGYAYAFAFGQVYEIEVRKDLPSFNLEIPEGSQQLAKESSLKLTAQAEFYDDYVDDVTQRAQWSSSDPQVATVEEGLVETKSTGSATIEAEYGGETASVEVEVVDEFGLSVVADEPPGEGTVIVEVEEKEQQWEVTGTEYIGEFKEGTEIKLEAIPDESYVFDYWMGIDSQSPEESIIIYESMTVRSKFVEDTAVEFADPELEEAVREAIDKPEGTIYQSEVADLESLNARGRGIESLEGIQHLQSLISLDLSSRYDADEGEWKYNEISDIAPLSELNHLGRLILADNQVEDISALSGMTDLYNLNLSRNSVSDISPLSGLEELSMLFIDRNQVSDISPLLDINYQKDDVYIDMEYNDLDLREGLEDVQNIRELENMDVDVDYGEIIELVDLVIPEGEQTLEAGETFEFTALAVYEDDSHVGVTGEAKWTCDDTDVVEMGEDGKVAGVEYGTTTVYAKWKGKTASSVVNVEEGEVKNYIKGKVTGGDPPEILADAVITVYQNGELIASTSCDHLGEFSLKVPLGTYDVQADSSGYNPETKENVEVKIFEEAEIYFYLTED